MPIKTTTQQAHGLVGYYKKKYKEVYGRAPKSNQYADKYGFMDVLSDMSEQEAKELLDFYFNVTSNSNHALQWFFYNYHTLAQSKSARDLDELRRAELREETRKRVEAYKERYGNDRGTTN